MRTLSTWLPKQFDWILLITAALILVIGLSTIQSTVIASPSQQPILSGELINRQLFAITLGVGLLVVLATVDYRRLFLAAPILYPMAVATLATVLIFGNPIRGAQRWLEVAGLTIQPSEFSKLFLLIVFASLLSWLRGRINRWYWLLFSIVILAIPSVLIYAEPDFGTMLIIGLLWVSLLYFSPIQPKKLLGFIGVLVLIIPVAWNLLAGYQQERILSFVNPERDPLGSGYNVRQSIIAIGSGKTLGQGWGRGTQSHLQFLPEQHTDFIFATFAEEQGFFGSVILLFLFAILIWRAIVIAQNAHSFFGELLAWGAVVLFFSQAFINLAMNIGLAPVTGIPLPLVSYGGSSIITHLAVLGILQSVAIH